METNVDFFSRRADEERLAAINASHPRARLAHLELAARYDVLAQTMIQGAERNVLTLVA